MNEEEARRHLNSQAGAIRKSAQGPAPRMVVRRPKPKQPEREAFKDFSATHLLCPTCRRATPVREKLLLYLPTGNLYDYVCTVCGTSVGRKS